MKLYYKIYGTGQPVIILHGLFGMGDNWRTIAKKMESRYQCILVDLRNHGRSSHDTVMNIQSMTEDLLELLHGLQIEKAILIGHSLGGKVAMQFALDHPDKVDKLIIVDIAPKHYPPQHDEVIEAIESVDPASWEDREDGEKVLKRFLGNNSSVVQFLMKNLSRLPGGGFEWKANMPVLISSYSQLVDSILSTEPFNGPVLFVRGENSGYILDEDFPEIQEIFPHASLMTVPKAGHWVHADAPEPFTKAVLSFLEETKAL